MAHKHESVQLGQVITLQRGYDITRISGQPGAVPVVSSGGIDWHHSTAMCRAPGVVIGRKGTLGTVHWVSEDYWPTDTTLFVRDFKGNDQRFVYYVLCSLKALMLSLDVGSANPTLNRNHIHPFVLRWPPLTTQRRIAGILGALDDKIELNRRMTATLEHMARALFRSWFVDFDPVRAKQSGAKPCGMDAATAGLFPSTFQDSPLGKIPKGWEVRTLDSIAEFRNGLALQKFPAADGEPFYPVIKIAQLNAANTDKADRANRSVPDTHVVNDGDLLFSWSGSLEVRIWFGGTGALNQHLFKVIPAGCPQWFVFGWLMEHLADFRAIASGKATTMGHIQRHHLTDAKVVVPGEPVLKALDRCAAPIAKRIGECQLESRMLAAVRDTLLPKLISGELPVTPLESAA
jgi:type I restriction enzyme S subunit